GPGFFLYIHRQAFSRARRIRARIYHASDLFMLAAMARAAASTGAGYVFDSRELYTGLGSTRRRPWASAFWSALERRLISRASLVMTVNDSIADVLADRYAIARPVVLPNVPGVVKIEPSSRLRQLTGLSSDEPIVLYQGFLKPGRGCEILIALASKIPGFSLVFLGVGPLASELRRQVERLGLGDRVRFLPMVEPDELLPLTADADIGACLIEGVTESLRLSLPNKLFEYLAAGVPVLASALPELSRIVDQYAVGLIAPTDDEDRMTEALKRLVEDVEFRRRLASNTRTVFDEYDPDRIRKTFLDAYRPLLSDV